MDKQKPKGEEVTQLIGDERQRRLDEALFNAVGRDDAASAQALLAQGANVNAVRELGENPIHLAASFGFEEVCAVLIAHAAQLGGFNSKRRTPLHCAAIEGHRECCRLLIDFGADINLQNENGEAPIHAAAVSRTSDALRLLIERGADVSARDRHGYSALHYAAMFNEVEAARILVDSGLSADELPALEGKYRMTPFQRAVGSGRADMVEYFIAECGAPVNQCTPTGQTMLELANDEGEMVELLNSMATQNVIASEIRPFGDVEPTGRASGISPL
jgi:ankyrin repeat protein